MSGFRRMVISAAKGIWVLMSAMQHNPHAVSKITPTVGYAPEEQTATYTCLTS